MLLLQHEVGRRDLATSVKNISAKKKNGFGFIWLCQGAGFEAHFIAKFKDWLISCCTQNWHLEIESDGKYKWFYLFKCTFEPEKCLLLIANKLFRDMRAKFRLRVCGLKKKI